MPACPKTVGNAKVICFTTIDERHLHAGDTKQIVNGVVLGPACGLAICQYPNEDSFYLFRCDAKWNVCSDTWHATLDTAIQQAEFEFETNKQTWQHFEQTLQ